jgi:hypothetical protein
MLPFLTVFGLYQLRRIFRFGQPHGKDIITSRAKKFRGSVLTF